MAPLYLMRLEDRVALARNRLDLLLVTLRSARQESERGEIERAVDMAASELQRISELIGP